MMKQGLLVILLLIAVAGAAQKDSIRQYLDDELHFTTKKNCTYPAMAVKSEDHWLLMAVYPDTAVLLKVFYKDAALRVKDGPFNLYNPKGKIAQNGFFKNNMAQGHWQTYYASGQIKEEGDICNNHFSGLWKAWYANGLPLSTSNYLTGDSITPADPVHEFSPGNVKKVLDDIEFEGVLEGPATTWYENGNKKAELNYYNDTLNGACSWYRQNGQPSSKETYVHGKVTELACYDSTGKYSGATCSILKRPLLIHPMFDALDYIEFELHKEKNKDISQEGEARVKFTVTQRGAIENLQVIASPDAALSRHIIQIFAAMPAWSPAVIHNQAVDYPMELAIPYYRQ